MLGRRIGIDLGTATTRVHLRSEGVVMSEPSIGAVRGDRVVAVGAAALDAAPDTGATLHRAVVTGGVGDVRCLAALLLQAVNRGAGRQRIFKPDVMVAVASAMPGRARRTVMEAVARAGARTTYLVDQPLAAALGAGVPVSTSTAHLVVVLGAGTTDVAVVSRETTVAGRCLRQGGADLSAAIARRISEVHGVDVGAAGAEQAKLEIGSAVPLQEECTLRLTGSAEGRSAEVVVSSVEVREATAPILGAIADAVRDVVADCPERTVEEIRGQTGILLAGGAARLRGLDRLLAAAAGGVVARVADDPSLAVVRGASAALEGLDVVRRNFLYVR